MTGAEGHPEWKGLLSPGERILWQGAPQRAFYWGKHFNSAALGGVFAVFVVVVFVRDEPWMVPLALAVAGLMVAMPVGWDAFRRRHSFFTLTDRAAFVGTDLPLFGRSLKRYDLRATTDLRIDRDALSAVFFTHEMRSSKNGKYRVDIGFENLHPSEAEDVYRLIQEIRKGNA